MASVVCVSLSGCANIASGMRGIASGFDQMGEDIATALDFDRSGGMVVQDAEQTVGYSDLVHEMSGGDVVVYDISNDASMMPDGSRVAPIQPGLRPIPAPASVRMPYGGGVTPMSPAEADVMIYPMGESGMYAPAPPARMPSIAPPSEARNPYHSPFRGPVPPMLQSSVVPAPPPLGGPYNTSFVNAPYTETAYMVGMPTRIYFRHGSDALNSAAKNVLQYEAERQRHHTVPLRVEGHASSRAETKDPVKQKIVNLKQSMNRAYNVSRYLIESGVSPATIETVAYGDTLPAPPIPGVDPEAANRRVEIHHGRAPATAAVRPPASYRVDPLLPPPGAPQRPARAY